MLILWQCPIRSFIPALPRLLGIDIFEDDALRDHHLNTKKKGRDYKHPVNGCIVEDKVVKNSLEDNDFAQFQWKHYYTLIDTGEECKQAFLRKFSTALPFKTIQMLDSTQYSIFLEACVAQESYEHWSTNHLKHLCAQPWTTITELTFDTLCKTHIQFLKDTNNLSTHLATLATQHNNINLLQWMSNHTNSKLKALLTTPLNNGRNIAHVVAMFGHLEVLKWVASESSLNTLLTITDAQSSNIAHIASANGHLPILQWIASDKSDPTLKTLLINSTNAKGFNIAHIAAMRGHLEVLKWVASDKSDPTLKALLTPPDHQGLTPYNLASQHNKTECMTFLNALQPEGNQRTNRKRTYTMFLRSQGKEEQVPKHRR